MKLPEVLRLVGTILAAVATSLAPQFGKDWWYAILVGVSGAFALVAPSIIPSPTISGTSQNAVPPKG